MGNWTSSGGNVYRSSGNVGIGTTTPSVSLHNNGDFITKGPWVDVRSFGAVGDGSTNDTQAVLDAVSSLGSNPGTIYFPPKLTFKLEDTDSDSIAVLLQGKSNISFVGDNTKIITANNISIFKLKNSQNIKFIGLRFEDTYGSSGTYHTNSIGISLSGTVNNEGSSYISILDSQFEGFKYGVYAMGNGGGTSSSIEKVTIDNSKFYDNYAGMLLEGYYVVGGKGSVHNWTISKTKFDTNYHWGVWMESGSTKNSYYIQSVKFTESDFLNTVEEHGLYVQGRNHSFVNCTFVNNNTAGIRSLANPGMRVVGSYFEGNGKNAGGGGYQSGAVMIGNERESSYNETKEGIGIIIEGNRFYDNYIGIDMYADKLGIKIVGNDIRESDTYGMVLRQIPESVISANTVANSGSDGIYVTSYGGAGAFSGVSEYVIIANNISVDNTGYGINISNGGSTHFKVTENYAYNNIAGSIKVPSVDYDGIFTTSGNLVGIGTTTPNNKLDIYSTTKSAIGFSGASGNAYKWTMGMDVSNGGRFSIASSTALGTLDRFVIDGNGNVGIGTTSPYARLSVVGETVAEKFTATSTTATSTFAGAFSVGSTTPAGNALFSVGTSSPLLFVDKNSGNVGIGTAAPNSSLSISNLNPTINLTNTSSGGTLSFNPSNGPYAYGLISAAGTYGGLRIQSLAGSENSYIDIGSGVPSSIKIYSDSSGSTDNLQLVSDSAGITFSPNQAELVRMTPTGLVGIGTTSPWAKLSIQNTYGSLLPLFDIASSTSVAYATSSLFRVNADGNVGVGTTSPWRTLSVTGSMAVTALTAGAAGDYAVCINNTTKELTNAGATGCVVSSKRFKENISELDSGLDELMQLKPSKFTYIGQTGEHIGLIAEDVNEVDKRLVEYEADGITPRTVRYLELSALLIKSIQDLNIKIDNLSLASTSVSLSADEAGSTDSTEPSSGLFSWIVNKFMTTLGIVFEKDMIEAEKVKAKNICVDDVCVTKSQFKELLDKNGITSSATISSSSSSANSESSVSSVSSSPSSSSNDGSSSSTSSESSISSSESGLSSSSESSSLSQNSSSSESSSVAKEFSSSSSENSSI